MRKMFFLINVEKDTEGYYAYVPALKGIHVGGDTEEEAEKNAKDAIQLYMCSILKLGDPLPTGFGVKTGPVETDPIRPLHIMAPFTQWDSQREDAPNQKSHTTKRSGLSFHKGWVGSGTEARMDLTFLQSKPERGKKENRYRCHPRIQSTLIVPFSSQRVPL